MLLKRINKGNIQKNLYKNTSKYPIPQMIRVMGKLGKNVNFIMSHLIEKD